jgi:serine/threonine protein kinase/Tol biopolymer transport system component
MIIEPFSTNHLIAHYRILSKLGAGGMGEVYLAEDTKLGRKVAIKLLPAEFTQDSGRVRRFEQEARATSALNHPNILTIFEIGEANGERYIATEFIDGRTLRERLNGDRLAPQAALDIAAQSAAALAAAHEAGIVHRDIKPENVMLRRDGIVKVLDFGLAKLAEHSPSAVDSQAPTIAKVNTDPGAVLGTVGYMSPEQVRGQETYHRADIFSFGVILYEMLSGRRAFSGESAIEVMNAILKEDPPEIGDTNAKVSPQLEKIVRRCLEKQPKRRFHSAHDLGFALEALSTPSGSRLETAALPSVTDNVVASSVRKRERLAWVMAMVLAIGMLGFAWAYFTRQPMTNDAHVMKFSILPPEKSSFENIAVSPDGRYLAFTAATGGKVQLLVRALGSTEPRQLDGTQGARLPFWSPDSRYIGFFAGDQLKKIEVTGGPAQTLCDAAAPFGGSWNRAGVIIFGLTPGGLFRVSATGGEIAPVTTLDRQGQENSHRYPTFLPDGRHFLYSIQSGRKETRGIYLGSLDGPLKSRLLDDFTVIKYVAEVPGDAANVAGWLLFVRDGALLARPFDTNRLDFTGDQFWISDKVGSDPLYFNYSTFSVSDNGVLVFDPSLKRQRRQYRWVDRRGQTIKELEVATGLGRHWLSPDEKRFIADRLDPQTITNDLWLCDVSGSNSQRFTNDPANDLSPVWEPSGRRIVWSSTRDGVQSLYQMAASGAGVETRLLKLDHPILPTDWSRDGRFIIFYQIDPKTKSDIWILPMTGSSGGESRPVVQTNARETAGKLSPDGHWLAYASDELSGRYDIWVQRFPEGGSKRQVSNGGGNGPRWRQDWSELFYYSADGKLMAEQAPRGESFETDAPVSLFEFRAGTGLASFTQYAVTRDGQRFLISEVVDLEPNAPMTVVTNWAAGLKK